MVALALMGAMSMGCSNFDDPVGNPDIIDEGKKLTLTATISLDGGAAHTRSLDAEGHKAFAVGDQIAVAYENTSGKMLKAVTAPLTAADITANGKTATITVTLTSPKTNGAMKYIYPAAMAQDNGTVNYAALQKQDGTLASLAANFDVALYEGSFWGEKLPVDVTLTNPLCIGEFSIKNDNRDITGAITLMTLYDGTNYYIVNRQAAAGPIYVAMKPTAAKNTLKFYATDGTTNYRKSVSGKALEAGNMYPVNLTMPIDERTALERLTDDYAVKNGETLTGVLLGGYAIKVVEANSTVTLDGVDINSIYPVSAYGIICLQKTNLILADGSDNKVVAGVEDHAGVLIVTTSKLTIWGNGSLKASGAKYGAGIGGSGVSRGGDIEIASGKITAEGGQYAAGIGSGYVSSGGTGVGNITISGGIVSAQGGSYGAGIGTGYANWASNKCGRIIIEGGGVMAKGGTNAAGIGTGAGNSYLKNQFEIIYITNGVNRVTAVGKPYSIGIGNGGSPSNNIYIGCTLDLQDNPIGGQRGMVRKSPYTYQP